MANIHQLSGAVVFCLFIIAACASSPGGHKDTDVRYHIDGGRYFDSGYMHR